MCQATLERQGPKFRRTSVMDMSLFKTIIDDCVPLGFNLVNLNFFNEPLLDPLLFDRIAYAKSKGLTVSMFTNGTLLTMDKIAKLLPSSIDMVVISIDGVTKDAYEKIRVGSDFHKVVRNTFNCLDARKTSLSHKPLIQLNMAVTSDNVDEVQAFQSFWHCYTDNLEVCPDKTQTFLPKNLRVATRYAFPCKLLWDELIVTSDGRVPLCCMDYNASIELGDLSKQSLKDVLQSETLKNVRNLHLQGRGNEINVCKHCDALYVSSAIRWLRA
jgi:radical SAM protein with 4Fe4S-binding SPASM domain